MQALSLRLKNSPNYIVFGTRSLNNTSSHQTFVYRLGAWAMGKNLKIDIGYPLLQPGDAGAFTPGEGGEIQGLGLGLGFRV